MPRPKAQGSLAKNQLQLAIALSTSLEESKTRELSKLAEELPADAIEDGAIPHNIKQMQKEFLDRLKPVAAAPSKRQRKKTKISVPVLYTRSSEERMRIITEKVALILIKECSADFYEVSEATCRKLYMNCNNETRLWNMSFLVPAIEEIHLYYITNLSSFISPTNKTSDVKPKNRFPLPGRFLTPQKRELDGETSSNISQTQMHTLSNTQNWSNTAQFNDRDLSDQDAQLEFQNDWLAMLNNPTMSDITIYTKNQQIVAHKLVIYARCPMILNDLEICGYLRWDNINYNDALAFLKFIYSGQLVASLHCAENAEGVVLLARKYKVLDLLKHIFASEEDFYETGVAINEGSLISVTNYIEGNALASVKSDESTKVLGPIEISSDDSMQLERTPERRKMLVKRSRVSFTPIPSSPDTSENSKRKLQDENSTRKLTTKKLCMEVSDEEEIPSPFKCTMLELSICDSSVSNPATPPGGLCDDGVSPFKESLDLNASQTSDGEPEILSKSLRADPSLQTAGTSMMYSPLKTPISSSNVPAQDFKICLEDSFQFDMRTPPQVRPESATPMRTPLTDVKTSSPVTPMPDYWAMSSEQLQVELCRFGLKRSLPRNKGIKMLKHIYEKLHPLVEVVVKGGRELFIPIDDKTPVCGADKPATNPLLLAVPAKDGELESSNEDQPLSDSSSDDSDVMEESIFAEEDNAGYEGLTDLKTITLAWISSNQDVYEKVLRYEPIWLESVHSELKGLTKQNIKLSHLMNVLDEEGVTFRMAQKNVEGGRRKKRASPKKKQLVGKKLTKLTTSQMPKE